MSLRLFSQQRGEQQKKGKAVLGITGSIDSGKKSPFSLDKNRGGAAPLGKMSSLKEKKVFNGWDGGCPTPCAILCA